MSNARQTRRDTLQQYGRLSVQLAALLKEGSALSEEDRLSIENSLLIVQLALALPKQNSKRSPSSSRHE